jgi:hypothetical protein
MSLTDTCEGYTPPTESAKVLIVPQGPTDFKAPRAS